VSLETIRPMVNRDSAYFWEGTQKRELRIQSCNACGALRHPPGPACPSCGALDRGHVVASGEGTVFSFVIHRHPPVPGKDLPIVIALIDLEEGVRMVGEVSSSDGHSAEDLAIGDRVRVDWNVVDDELTLPVWRRA
jgi:uncharacterized OB-fold protein